MAPTLHETITQLQSTKIKEYVNVFFLALKYCGICEGIFNETIIRLMFLNSKVQFSTYITCPSNIFGYFFITHFLFFNLDGSNASHRVPNNGSKNKKKLMKSLRNGLIKIYGRIFHSLSFGVVYPKRKLSQTRNYGPPGLCCSLRLDIIDLLCIEMNGCALVVCTRTQ